MCVVEICTVVDGSLFARSAAEDFRAPGIQVGIEMNDADGAIGFVYGAEQRERDCMVTAQSDDAGKGFAFLCRANFVCVGLGAAHEKSVMAVLDLLDGVGVVITGMGVLELLLKVGSAVDVRSDRNIATV